MDETSSQQARCAQCDSVLSPDSDVCIMCGASVETAASLHERGEPATNEDVLDAHARSDADAPTDAGDAKVSEGSSIPETVDLHQALGPIAKTSGADVQVDRELQGPEPTTAIDRPEFIESTLQERQSRIVFWMTGAVAIITVMLGSLILRYGGPVELILAPTVTPIPSTATLTPSSTPQGTPLGMVTETPTLTPEPTMTPTLQPPRVHEVSEGETLFGLAYIYNVTMDVIAELNGFSVETPIQSGQTLQVPWPTATPPLQPVVVEINGEEVIADPTNCERYEIQAGDALSVIAARNNINFDLLLQVNRLTDQSVMQPGDTVCIPQVLYGQVLPPTPGPSPTPSATSFPPGPALLYPTNGIVVDMSSEPIILQWLAVKDLAPDEWYMVELTNVSEEGQHPQRAFTRDNVYRIPGTWRPHEEAYYDFRWRVAIVTVTGQREDGGFIYTFGGRNSEDGYFSWRGAVPTPTPTATPTNTPEP